MSRILVTGGAGFIGSHLVDRLASERSNYIVVLDNLRRGRLENLSKSLHRIRFIQADIRERAAVEEAMRNVDIVYHLAAQSNVMGSAQDIDYSFSTNVNGTFEVLRAAAAGGVKRLLFASSREVYGEPACLPVKETAPLTPKNAYGASKAAGEAYCGIFNSPAFQVRTVRLTNVYGPRDFGRVIPIFAHQALKGEPLTLFGGKQIIDFVWIDHAVESLIRAIKVDALPGPINVGTGIRTDLQTLARRIILVAKSNSQLCIAPAREVEVAQFVADTLLQKKHLGLDSPEDPLMHLPFVVQSVHNDPPASLPAPQFPAPVAACDMLT
jgi:UDP-glucose 4-epimerase